MGQRKVMFSPVTRLSGLLSVEVAVDGSWVANARASATMFRGFEWIMRERHVTDAVYMTQRVCGICSLAHGAVASYLLDDLYDNDIAENAQYLRNIMYASDFLQNHIRHFYLFSLPDFVLMPDSPPFQGQNLADARLSPEDNRRLASNYFEAIKAAQKCHEILALFGGKAPHQHSFVHGGASVAPTADKINSALSLITEIGEFIAGRMVPDTDLISRVYSDYFKIGITPDLLLSFGLFRFGSKNKDVLWKGGVLTGGKLADPRTELITEDVAHSWFDENCDAGSNCSLTPDPSKQGAYTWVKSVKYAGRHYQVGPLARMLINGFYRGGTSTMDRICARTVEAYIIMDLVKEWLKRLVPGPPPISRKKTPVKGRVTAVTDAMRGALLHSARVEDEKVAEYNIITPTVWNFSPRDRYYSRGPVEGALVGTRIPQPDMLYTVLGRIVRSFDPCMACATHVIDMTGKSER